MIRISIIFLLALSIISCTTTRPKPPVRPIVQPKPSFTTVSELRQGKRYFNDGYYKKAMHILLPLACECNPEAEYAVGYMYYYGLGVAQDTDVGYFWIERSACQNFYPAIEALRLINSGRSAENKVKREVKCRPARGGKAEGGIEGGAG